MSTLREASGLGPRSIADAVNDGGLIAILRAPSAEHFASITEALLKAGIGAIEITMTTSGAVDAIADMTRAFGDDAIIGAGTVLTTHQAERCVEAGAKFLVSPVFADDVVQTGRAAGIATYTGALTPTEMFAASQAGATAIKLFPASAVSPRYIQDLHGPMPDLEITPTGGIAVEDIGDWIRAGAAAVGLGSPLTGSAVRDGINEQLSERARRAIAAVTEARASR